MHYEKADRARFIQRDIFGQQFEGISLGCVKPTKGGGEKFLERFCEWIQNPKYFLVYSGGYGIGKTTLSAALVSWALEKFDSVRFITETIFIQKIKAQMSMQEGDCTKEIFNIANNEFFLYDDLGSERVKEENTAWRPISVLVDYRWSSNLPTVITTNLTENEILENYGGRVHSRLFDARNTIIEDRESYDHRISG